VERPDQTVVCRVEVCECGCDLRGCEAVEVERRQIFDLPVMKLHVTEYQAQIKECPQCGQPVKAAFPAVASQPVQYGPRAQAAMTYLSQYQLLPFERLQELLHDLFQMDGSQGTLNNVLKRGYRKLAVFEEQLKERIRNNEAVHFDETGIRVVKELNWLHVASTPELSSKSTLYCFVYCIIYKAHLMLLPCARTGGVKRRMTKRVQRLTVAKNLGLQKYTIGVGDRFGRQANAQLEACLLAEKSEIIVSPIWNKSNREHNIIGSEPSETRQAADAAVRPLGWKHLYFCDADHIGFTTVDRFLAPCDFFTIDVADQINQPASEEAIQAFTARHGVLTMIAVVLLAF
jgi:transposase